MNIVNVLFNISQVLSLTIIHSLWQGMLVYFILRMILAFRLSASKKYLLSVVSLFLFTGWFIYTLINEIHIYNWLVIKAQNPAALPLMLAIPAGAKHFQTEATRYYYDIKMYLPYLAALYTAGILYNSTRLIMAYRKINLVKHTLVPNAALQYLVNSFAGMFHIGRQIKVGYSTLIDVPCMTGFLKPLILLPFTLTTLLSADEVEAIILHEIAHIKRNDYIINLAQQIITVILFFNPFAWLINGIINRERENCCDNIVVKTIAKPLAYAQALLKIEQNARQEWRLALAATGKKHYLLTRIEYIMKTRKPTGSIRQVILTLLIFAMATTGLAWLNPTVANGKISVKNITPAISKIIKTLSNPVNGAIPQNDTTKKQAGIVKDTTKVAADTSNSYSSLFGFDDPKMDSLWRAYKKHSSFVNGYFKTDYYLDLKRKLYGDESANDDFYNNDTLKNLMTAFKGIANHIKVEYGSNTGKNNLLQSESVELGLRLGSYYTGGEFKTLNAQLQQKYGIIAGKDYQNSDKPNYEKYQAAIKKGMPANVKEQMKRLKEVNAQLGEIYTSDDFKGSLQRLHELSDNLNIYNSKPHVKQHEYVSDNTKSTLDNLPEDLRKKYIDQEEAYIQNPEYKKEWALLRQYMDEMSAYMKTPDFKKHEKQWESQLRTALGSDYDSMNTYQKGGSK